MPGPVVNEAQAVRARKQSRNKQTPSRHSLKCAVCNHPDRAAIEFDFLNWRNPGDLVKGYRFRGLSTIYRHAHATGLFAKRRLNLRFAMERIVERVNEVPVTATSVIRAARAISRINDSGEWVDPPSRVIVTHINAEEVGDPAPHRPRRSKRSRGQRGVRPSVATRHSPPSTVFDDVLLDEPSESASAELPRIDGKPAPPEVILQLTPEFARCREERRRALEADRAARAAWASGSGGFTPPASSQTENVPSSSSLLPQAAFLNSASPALPHPAANENNVADVKQSVAMPSSSLPPRAAGPPLGSSGSANPPFPFTPEPLRRWKPRRRF